jgi:hypothetical protein
MYFFLIFGMPLGFLLLVLDAYPRSEYPTTRRAFIRGLVAFVPIWLVARILGAIVPAAYGSFLLTFHEWADRILPYAALPALAYLVFYRPGEPLPIGALPRRLTAFYAGALTPVGLCETLRIWGNPAPYPLFFLPIILGAICLFMPKSAVLVNESYGFGLAASIAGIVAATFAASLCPFLLLARLWPITIALVASIGAGAWLYAYPELRRHQAQPLDE